MTDTVVRFSCAEDISAIAELEALLFSDAWSKESVSSMLSSPLSYALLIEREGKTVGYLLASLLSPEGELYRIGVHPLYRRLGLGACLMERFVRDAGEKKCTDLFLEVRADNAAAIELYRRFGFSDNGIRRGYYQNPDADALLMRLEMKI